MYARSLSLVALAGRADIVAQCSSRTYHAVHVIRPASEVPSNIVVVPSRRANDGAVTPSARRLGNGRGGPRQPDCAGRGEETARRNHSRASGRPRLHSLSVQHKLQVIANVATREVTQSYP